MWPTFGTPQGIDPDLGNAELAVVPHLPDGSTDAAGRAIRVGAGEVGVSVRRNGDQLTTKVSTSGVHARLTVGAVLPEGVAVSQVRLDGKPATYNLVRTSRGTELHVVTRAPSAELQILLRSA